MRKSRYLPALVLVPWVVTTVAAELPGHSHAMENPLVYQVMADELEWQDVGDNGALAWDAVAWLGRDEARVYLRSEGSRTRGANDDTRHELLVWRPVGSWWNGLAGIRHDTGEGPSRTYGLLGLQGTAPYRIGIEADLVAGERGQFGTRIEAEYRWLITNRLIATPRTELQAWGRDDLATGLASGLAKLEAGIRFRYEFRREFAPYLGVEWVGTLGDTADIARSSGMAVRDTRVVAGLRTWF
jgi:copper resistance protein B